MWVCVVSCVGKEAEIQTNLWSSLENGAISWYTQQDKVLDKLRQTDRERRRERGVDDHFLFLSALKGNAVGFIDWKRITFTCSFEVAFYFTLRALKKDIANHKLVINNNIDKYKKPAHSEILKSVVC